MYLIAWQYALLHKKKLCLPKRLRQLSPVDTLFKQRGVYVCCYFFRSFSIVFFSSSILPCWLLSHRTTSFLFVLWLKCRNRYILYCTIYTINCVYKCAFLALLYFLSRFFSLILSFYLSFALAPPFMQICVVSNTKSMTKYFFTSTQTHTHTPPSHYEMLCTHIVRAVDCI